MRKPPLASKPSYSSLSHLQTRGPRPQPPSEAILMSRFERAEVRGSLIPRDTAQRAGRPNAGGSGTVGVGARLSETRRTNERVKSNHDCRRRANEVRAKVLGARPTERKRANEYERTSEPIIRRWIGEKRTDHPQMYRDLLGAPADPKHPEQARCSIP